ncbi:MAG TPA: 30S ribosomal protein S16 [Candidatus Binatia bacterium]|jgi:small subunit ribosomal protein S16|nr:30S ribosomal protein S16 [Candidatus Binatia bacterium]
MAVKIRLSRHGSKKRPFYRVVVADVRAPRDGRNLAEIGTYDPLTDPVRVQFDAEKVSSWLKKGATPTPTVANLLRQAGLSS